MNCDLKAKRDST